MDLPLQVRALLREPGLLCGARGIEAGNRAIVFASQSGSRTTASSVAGGITCSIRTGLCAVRRQSG